MSKVVLITGGSSGIGKAVAVNLRDADCKVYEMSRKPSLREGILHIDGDITDEESVKTVVEKVIAEEGKIDILINNAGFGISGAIEFTDVEDAKKQLDVNFFGGVRMCRHVLPYMRKAGYGRIVNLSSVAAPVPIPFQAFYSASKAAVSSYTMALDNEVKPYGIRALAVMPGDVHTGFTDAREKEISGDEEYGGRIAKSVKKMEKDELGGMEAGDAGAYVAKLALKKSVKPLYAIRFDYKFFVLLSRLLPVKLLNWMIGKLYA